MRETAEDYQEFYDDWVKEYRPVKFIEYSAENLEFIKTQDERYIWTDHDTCEDSMVTAGFHFFGDPPRCCWVTHGWHITEVAHNGESERINTSAYLPCECYDEENDTWDEDCEECEGEGHINHYFD